jgi:hypothetical protein
VVLASSARVNNEKHIVKNGKGQNQPAGEYDADVSNHQVHADASAFREGLSKKEVYAQVLEQARALFAGQRSWVSYTTSIYLYIIPTHIKSISTKIQQVWYAIFSLSTTSNLITYK